MSVISDDFATANRKIKKAEDTSAVESEVGAETSIRDRKRRRPLRYSSERSSGDEENHSRYLRPPPVVVEHKAFPPQSHQRDPLSKYRQQDQLTPEGEIGFIIYLIIIMILIINCSE